MDKSNGYERIAKAFIKGRGHSVNGIGASTVRAWAKSLSKPSTVLDLGCGTGIPISKVMVDEGLTVYGIDASPTMVEAFAENFPNAPVICESVENSQLFNRKFDAVICWGLIFLLPEDVQVKVIRKAAEALHRGGRLLFTSPSQEIEWNDIMTGMPSRSLGAEKYKKLLHACGMLLIGEFEDEGENHYFDAMKMKELI
jgi:2-polyprenyl-3-methyl-5-hydroxy-6-metoxy-1,4-benzoquinol methylase